MTTIIDGPLLSVTKHHRFNIYQITMHHGDDNRINTEFCQAMLKALETIEELCPVGTEGAVMTTGRTPKFYSNGLDLEHAISTSGFWEESLYPVFRRFLTYHLPTVAAINGHAFAAGAMMAACHDYRIGNSKKGFVCLNEVAFGAPLQTGMLACVGKILNPAMLRKCVLEGHRFAGQELVESGFVDAIVAPENDGVVQAATKEAERVMKFAATGVYGKLKLIANAPVLDQLSMTAYDLWIKNMDAYDALGDRKRGAETAKL